MSGMNDVLGKIKEIQESGEVRAPGEKDPRFSDDPVVRLRANTNVSVARDNKTILFRVANVGPKNHKASCLKIAATDEAIDNLAAELKAMIRDEEYIGEKLEGFKTWLLNLKNKK